MSLALFRGPVQMRGRAVFGPCAFVWGPLLELNKYYNITPHALLRDLVHSHPLLRYIRPAHSHYLSLNQNQEVFHALTNKHVRQRKETNR